MDAVVPVGPGPIFGPNRFNTLLLYTVPQWHQQAFRCSAPLYSAADRSASRGRILEADWQSVLGALIKLR